MSVSYTNTYTLPKFCLQQVLKDEKKRAAYDQYGSTSQQPGFDSNAFSTGQGGFSGGFGQGGFAGFQDFSAAFGRGGAGPSADLFEQFFGNFAGGRTQGSPFSEPSRGSDLESSIGLSFLEACKGSTKSVNVSPVVDCGTCEGSGLKTGAKRSTCTACGGSGTRTFVLDSGFHMASTCTSCHGVGSTIPRNGQCSTCNGMGKVRIKKVVQVKIPPGRPHY